MSSHDNFLNNLRKKPETTKNLIAAVFAIIPAVLVGYAQFYMNEKVDDKQIAVDSNSGIQEKTNDLSAIASIGKIFIEGKSSLMQDIRDFKKIDEIFLNEANKYQNASNTAAEIDGSEITIDDVKINTTLK